MSTTCNGTTRHHVPCQNPVANTGDNCGRCRGPRKLHKPVMRRAEPDHAYTIPPFERIEWTGDRYNSRSAPVEGMTAEVSYQTDSRWSIDVRDIHSGDLVAADAAILQDNPAPWGTASRAARQLAEKVLVREARRRRSDMWSPPATDGELASMMWQLEPTGAYDWRPIGDLEGAGSHQLAIAGDEQFEAPAGAVNDAIKEVFGDECGVFADRGTFCDGQVWTCSWDSQNGMDDTEFAEALERLPEAISTRVGQNVRVAV